VEGKHNEQFAVDFPALLPPKTMYSTQGKKIQKCPFQKKKFVRHMMRFATLGE